MAAPITLTNQFKIVNAIERLINTRMTHALGYYTDGALVDQSRDPRVSRTEPNKQKLYAEKGVWISLHLGPRKEVGNKSLSGAKRWEQNIQFWCLQTLSKADDTAGITLNRLESQLQLDLVKLCDYDSDLKKTFAILHGESPDAGYNHSSCINLRIPGFEPVTNVLFPDVFFIGYGMCQFDDFRSRM